MRFSLPPIKCSAAPSSFLLPAEHSFVCFPSSPPGWILESACYWQAQPGKALLKANFSFRPPKHMNLGWSLLGFMELLVLLRFRTFPLEEKAIFGVTSGQRLMEWCAFPLLWKEDYRSRIPSLNGVRMTLKSAQETSLRHIWGRKTLF